MPLIGAADSLPGSGGVFLNSTSGFTLPGSSSKLTGSGREPRLSTDAADPPVGGRSRSRLRSCPPQLRTQLRGTGAAGDRGSAPLGLAVSACRPCRLESGGG